MRPKIKRRRRTMSSLGKVDELTKKKHRHPRRPVQRAKKRINKRSRIKTRHQQPRSSEPATRATNQRKTVKRDQSSRKINSHRSSRTTKGKSGEREPEAKSRPTPTLPLHRQGAAKDASLHKLNRSKIESARDATSRPRKSRRQGLSITPGKRKRNAVRGVNVPVTSESRKSNSR